MTSTSPSISLNVSRALTTAWLSLRLNLGCALSLTWPRLGLCFVYEYELHFRSALASAFHLLQRCPCHPLNLQTRLRIFRLLFVPRGQFANGYVLLINTNPFLATLSGFRYMVPNRSYVSLRKSSGFLYASKTKAIMSHFPRQNPHLHGRLQKPSGFSYASQTKIASSWLPSGLCYASSN